MNKKPVVNRMDILSRKKYPKDELIRLVKQDDKLVLNGDLKGRGIYIHKDRETILKVFNKGLLKRYNIDNESLKEELLSYVE